MRSLVGYGFLAPANIIIMLCLLGAVIALVWRRTGIAIALAASLCLFVAATPAFSSYLTTWLESQIPTPADLNSAQAIIVLGADIRPGDAGVPDRLGPQSLERVVEAARAYRRLHLPVAVSGGRMSGWHASVARLMKEALERYYAVPVTWSEDRSQNTFENAAYTVQLLRAANIHTAVLVTPARDLPRAIWAFQRAGLQVLPWSTPRTVVTVNTIEDYLPSVSSLLESDYTLHELIGELYYRIHY